MAGNTAGMWFILLACLAAIPGIPEARAAAAGASTGPGAREPVELTYRFRRGDLETPAGARRAYRTLLAKARRTCRFPGGSPLELRRTDHACVGQLVEDVVARIAAPLLTLEHEAGGAPPLHGGVPRRD